MIVLKEAMKPMNYVGIQSVTMMSGIAGHPCKLESMSAYHWISCVMVKYTATMEVTKTKIFAETIVVTMIPFSVV